MCTSKATATFQFYQQFNLFFLIIAVLPINSNLLIFTVKKLRFQCFILSCSINYCFNKLIQFCSIWIISHCVVTNAIISHHFIYLGLIMSHCTIDANWMSPVGINKFHARDIRIAITDIHHIAERNTYFVWSEWIIYTRIVDIQNAFFDTKQELSLICIVDNLCRPFCYPIRIIIKGTRIYSFECTIFRNRCPFNHFLQTWRDNIVLNNNTVFRSICTDAFKPILNTGK